MNLSRHLFAALFALALLPTAAAPIAHAADAGEFPVPKSNRFT